MEEVPVLVLAEALGGLTLAQPEVAMEGMAVLLLLIPLPAEVAVLEGILETGVMGVLLLLPVQMVLEAVEVEEPGDVIVVIAAAEHFTFMLIAPLAAAV